MESRLVQRRSEPFEPVSLECISISHTTFGVLSHLADGRRIQILIVSSKRRGIRSVLGLGHIEYVLEDMVYSWT